MGICCLEKKCHRISEIYFLPSLKAKLLFTVCDGIPCRPPLREGPLELYKKVEQLQKHLLNKSLLEMFEAAASGRCLNSLLFG